MNPISVDSRDDAAAHAPLRSVLLAGGGTAGHVNPLLAVVEELARRDSSTRITVLGTATGLEARLVPARGLTLALVPRVPLPRRPTLDWFRLPVRLLAAVRAAGAAIDSSGAQVVVGFGGYVSTPAYLAARRRRIPVVVHEANARPGLANRLGARWAAEVAVTFPGTRLPGAQVTGMPLRAAVAALVDRLALDPVGTRAAALAALGLAPGRPVVLVTGGSLGAVRLNAAVAEIGAELVAGGAQVLHLTGTGKADAVRDVVAAIPAGGQLDYHVLEYLAEMELAYAVAALVVCRSGAATVSELAALGLPAVYVPLPIGNGEQRLNAAPVVAAGGGLLVDDADLTPGWLRRHVLPLLGRASPGEGVPQALAAMGRAAASVGVRDGAARVADLVQRAAGVSAVTARPAAPVALEDFGRTHLIGVGGAGMSVVAALLCARGLEVSGSDARDGVTLTGLRRAGVTVWVGHAASHVEHARTVVVSTAVRESNPELVRARELGLVVLHRSKALAALMADRRAIAVAGAHGKTTTSAMIAVALASAGLDPSYAIGGSVLPVDGAVIGGPLPGAHDGTGDVFVAEADESDGSFLAYAPTIAVVTNVEPDHLDHYGTRAAFERAFTDFAALIDDGGALVACADDAGAARLVEAAWVPLGRRGGRILTYGEASGADVVVSNYRAAGAAGSVFVLRTLHPALTASELELEVTLAVPGKHNALNAAAAWTTARLLGVDGAAAAAGLAEFRGTGRRFEDRGSARGVRVVDDYAHHPTEVAALLRAARPVARGGRVLVLFQPHLYSRTRLFAAEFAAALDLADGVVVTDVYGAREDPDPAVTSALITSRMGAAGKAELVPDRIDAARCVAERAEPGDLVLTVGAGDVTELAQVVLDALASRPAP